MREIVYPKITVSPKLPLNYQEAKAYCEDGIKYETKEVYRQEFKNIFVFSWGLIYKPNKPFYKHYSLVPESAVHETWFRYSEFYSLTTIVKDYLKNKIRILPIREKYISLFDMWSSNHYHLHVDFLPRLLFLKETEPAQLTLLLPDTPYFRNSIQSILTLFNFNFKNILYLKSGEIAFVKQCLFISKTVTTGFSNPDLIGKLKERINLPNTQPSKRIYVKRKNTPVRKVLNEAEVEEILINCYGFEVVDFSDYPIAEQVQLAANTQIMVGMHGAGLTNVLFMPKGTKLVEFRRNGLHYTHCYWHLAAAVGIDYSLVFGEPDDESKYLEGEGCNLYIPIDDLKRVLNKVLKDN